MYRKKRFQRPVNANVDRSHISPQREIFYDAYVKSAVSPPKSQLGNGNNKDGVRGFMQS